MQNAAGRPYRSKKQRPCDLCRFRKTQCKTGETEGTCELCKKTGRHCTFVEEPIKKPRTSRLSATFPSLDGPGGDGAVYSQEQGEERGQKLVEGTDVSIERPPFGTSSREHFWMDQPPDNANDFEAMFAPSNEGVMTWSNTGLDLNASSVAYSARAASTVPSAADAVPTDMSPSALQPTDAVLRTPQHADLYPRGSGQPLQDRLILTDNISQSPQDPSDFRYSMSQESIDGWPEQFSLDAKNGYSFQFIGFSGEMDPFLLRHYYYDSFDNYSMHKLDFRKINCAESQLRPAEVSRSSLQTHVPIHFVMTNETMHEQDLQSTQAILLAGASEASDVIRLNDLVSPEVGARLVKLYIDIVHPVDTVLSLRDVRRLSEKTGAFPTHPIGIKAAVYALSVPFSYLDDELSVAGGYLQLPADELWAIAQRSYQRVAQFSHLSSLQMCLLLLRQPPQNYAASKSPSEWSLSCSAVSIAEALGLNLDPAGWRMPRWEIQLRRRLWWLTFIQHTWQALLHGRPSHLNPENYSVSPLHQDDFKDVLFIGDGQENKRGTGISSTVAFCNITLIAHDLLQALYTVKAVSEATDLPTLLSRAQPLRARVEAWRRTVPLLANPIMELSDQDIDDCASLRLTHLTVENLIFRALLRPLTGQNVTSDQQTFGEARLKIFENSLTCAKLSADLVGALNSRHFASVWPTFTRYQICYISNLTLSCFVQSPTIEYALRARQNLLEWRKTLRTQARAWPLARLATIRLDAAFWKSIARVTHGSGPDSPANIVLRDHGI